MNKYTGKSVFGGIAIGKIVVYEKGEHQVKRVKVTLNNWGNFMIKHFAKLARLMRQYLRFIR